MAKNLKLENKVAVITGGSSGIGLAAAEEFITEGARVIIIGRDENKLESAAQMLGERATAVRADVSKPSEIISAIASIGEKFGKIDVLFANAGMSECPPILETDEAFFDEIMDLNVKGVFFTFIYALPLLANRASVIFTSSAAHDMGRPGDPLYAAGKAAVRSFARTLAADDLVLEKKIRVNSISPGPIRTPLTIQDTPEMERVIEEYIESSVPMGRWGEPREAARAALFLASEDSSFITGADIPVDGGLGQI